tara:strand:+ start:184 stop:339 length:156 start_codon:yes stop_codon:yes gene_type:complete
MLHTKTMRYIHIVLISAIPMEIGNTLNQLDNVTSKKFNGFEVLRREMGLKN